MEITSYLSSIELVDYFVVILNLILMIFADRILQLFQTDESNKTRFLLQVHSFRALNLLIILSYGYANIYHPESTHIQGYRLVLIWVVIYLAYLVKQILSYWIHRRYGKVREVNGEKRSIETYNSRLLSLLSGIVIFVIALLSIINLLEFESLLQAGGVVGFIGVFLALTQNAWAPDIISGLILLNTGMIEEGDVIEFNDNGGVIGMVFKTKLFHTEILNLVNNHRIMLKNTRLREFTIQNLSKFASARGLREKLTFKIGYEVAPEKVRQMFNAVLETAGRECLLEPAGGPEIEVAVSDTGDHAVEWVLYYYTKDVRSLMATRQKVRECVLDAARQHDIKLATPITHMDVTHT